MSSGNPVWPERCGRPSLPHPPELPGLIRDGAVCYISHSGGKDSQAMYLYVCSLVPHDQVVVVHADLGHVEWNGIQDHIRSNIDHELHVVRARKTFLDMVRDRHRKNPDVPCWPSPRYRQCTSDLKRGPIERFIRQDLRRRGRSLAVSCMGLRAEESAFRRARAGWGLHRRLSAAGRQVYEWLPIQDLSVRQVFGLIRRGAQRPFWVYSMPNDPNRRVSCVFCIMGCGGDLKNGAIQRPELLAEITQVEQETGWTFFPGESLAERIARTS